MESQPAENELNADTLAFGALDLNGGEEELQELGTALHEQPQQSQKQSQDAQTEEKLAQDEAEEEDDEGDDVTSLAGGEAACPDSAAVQEPQEGPNIEDEGAIQESDLQELEDSTDEEAAGSQLATMASLAMENLSMLSTSSAPEDRRSDGGAKEQRREHEEAAEVPGAGEDASWRSQPKHFLILTSSGKPVYTYHGDADSLAGLMALITALVSVVQDQGDKLHHLITGGGTLVVMIMRGPLILVAASRCGEAVEVLQRQLELMYRQLLLIVTTGVERILLRNPAYDVRTLLGGVGAVLTSLAQGMHSDASYLLHGLQPVVMNPADRMAYQAALAEAVKSSGAYYGALLVSSGGYVVAEQRGIAANGKPLPPLDAWDVMLLENFVACNSSIRLQHGEAFCPLCLPAYNSAAFLHAYIHFLTGAGSPKHQAGSETSGQLGHTADLVGSQSSSLTVTPAVYLVLLSPTSDSFHALSSARQALEQQLQAGGQLQRFQESLQPDQGSAWLTIEQLLPAAGGGKFGCTPLWHFMARFVTRRQVVCARYTKPYTDIAAREQLVVSYGRLHSMLVDVPPGSRPNKLVWLCNEQQAMLAVADPEVELLMVLDPLCDKPTAQRCAEQLRKHVGSTAFQQRL